MDYVLKQLNPGFCKTYLIVPQNSKNAIIVDPVIEHVKEYLDLLEKEGLVLKYIIDTHTHADHITGGPSLKDHTDAKYVMHSKAPARCVSHQVEDGDEIELDGLVLKFITTPGHTQDSVSVILPKQVLTGDALFLDDGGAGRDDLPGGDPGAHWESLKKLSELPNELMVYPAHEYRDRKPSTILTQKTTNPHLKPRTKEEFINYLNDLKLGPADWMKDVLKANYTCARDPKAAWIPADLPACEVKGTMDLGINAQVVSDISVEELKQRLDGGEKPYMLDVREPHELVSELGQLDGVVNIPIGTLIADLDQVTADQNQEIIMVCRSGGRAHTAAQVLMQAGYTNVRVMMGGMLAWQQAFG